MDPNNTAVSADELKAEQEALAEAKAEEIRTKVVEEYGFDPETDQERIDKLVNERMQNHQVKASLTRQKVTWREKATKPPAQPSPVTPPAKPIDPADIDKTVDEKLNERLQQRDLDEMDYPDEIKTEIKRVAKITGKSVKQAAKDPYIVATYIEPWQKENKADEAAISRRNRSSGNTTVSMDQDPPEIDSSSPEKFAETSKKYEEWKEAMKAKGY